MPTLEQLSAIEEIKRVKAKYFYYMDSKNWEGWRREVFAPDARMHVSRSRPEPYEGIDAILKVIEPLLKGVKSIHHGHMPIIEITSPTTATGIWAMEDVLFLDGRPQFGGMSGRVHGYGHYHETYERGEDGWRIKTMRLVRLHTLAPLQDAASPR
jgi:hypothetical protein